MAALVILVVMLAMFGGSDAAWCVCRQDVSQAAQQKTLDYACGAGADCSPILQNGPCYLPNAVDAHCSYAANSYYQRKGQAAGTCDFTGTATLTNQDPSASGCTYPATTSAAGTSTTPTGTTTGTPSTFSPTTGTATGTGTVTGTGPGVLSGLGPSGSSISTDNSGSGFIPKAKLDSLLLPIFFSVLLLLRI